VLEGFSEKEFSHDGRVRSVFRRGSGPGVVVMHEIPGITPEVARFARWVADAGFAVAMPLLFGTPGRPMSQGYATQQMLRACVSREFSLLAAHRASPITEWLRALCRALHAECGGPGVGAIGMCITGNFALALAVDDALMAPVLSQPSLPLPLGRARRAALHVTPEALACARSRAASDGLRVLGLRFHEDPLCPPERFETLRRELGSAFEGIEIDARFGNPAGNRAHNRSPHSVVTTDLVDEKGHPTRQAADRVIEFFGERLRAGGASGP
jgi:dienelactone hydrolase